MGSCLMAWLTRERVGFAALAVLLLGVPRGVAGCRPHPRIPPPAPPFQFVDTAAQAGLDFVHLNGEARPVDLVRTTGSGIAWIDYDRDGWPDLFCVNEAPPDQASSPHWGHRLYRNRRNGTFEDVTERAGVRGAHEDGFGVAVGDYDGDGWPDLYLTCLGPNHLYRNRRNGTFVDVAAMAGVAGPAKIGRAPKWSTAAAWLPASGGGALDLYVADYCSLDPGQSPLCRVQGVATACTPSVFRGQPDLFFRNLGTGRFVQDPSRFPLSGRPPGRGLGVLPFDADEDGRPDLFIANDGGGNFFFHKEGNHFVETAYAAGLALDAGGADPAGMGADAADYDGDGRVDLVLGNFQDQPNVLYRQAAPLLFQDVSAATGLAAPTRQVLTFGTGFVDCNLDGTPEILFVNGHVQDNIRQIRSGVSAAQGASLFRWSGGTFQDASAGAGPAFQQALIGRGAAFADYDRDGDVDVAVSVNGGRVQLWRNDSPHGHWLQVELRGKRPNTAAIGALVSVRAGGRTQRLQVLTGRSYLSDSERVLTFGLGATDRVDTLAVRWPGGQRREVAVDGIDRRITVTQE